MVLQYLLSWFTPSTVLIYLILSAAPAAYMAKESKKFIGTDELNKKYYAFHRYDAKNWTFGRLFINNIIFLMPIRFITAWSLAITVLIFTKIIMIGQDKTKPVTKWREESCRLMVKVPSRIHMFMCGLTWINFSKRPDVDYKEWLGPDWKPTFEGPGLQVCNH